MDDEAGKKLNEIFKGKLHIVRIQPGHYLVPAKMIFYAQKIRDMPVYEDDIWMISFPRTGECLSIAIINDSRNYKKKIKLEEHLRGTDLKFNTDVISDEE